MIEKHNKDGTITFICDNGVVVNIIDEKYIKQIKENEVNKVIIESILENRKSRELINKKYKIIKIYNEAKEFLNKVVKYITNQIKDLVEKYYKDKAAN